MLLYIYVFWVLYRYIILSFDMYHGSIMHMHVRTLLSDDAIVVSVNTMGATIGANLHYHLIFVVVLICFVVVLFCFYFCLFVSDSSWSIMIYMCGGCFVFLLAIALPFHRFTASDYPFGIFKLF